MENPLKAALKRGEAQVGSWLSLCSPFAARFMARAGFRWLTVDIEHSPVNLESAALIFAAVADAGCVPLARVPSNSHENIKRVLDNGAISKPHPGFGRARRREARRTDETIQWKVSSRRRNEAIAPPQPAEARMGF